MGDRRRFDAFARALEVRFPTQVRESRSRFRALKVADVAGGKGALQLAMHERGFRGVVTMDRRNSNRLASRLVEYRRRFLTVDERERFDLFVGMHPDAATDVIVAVAAAQQAPFAIVPCCIRPQAFPYGGPGGDQRLWCDHLERIARRLGFLVERVTLPIHGAAEMLVGRFA